MRVCIIISLITFFGCVNNIKDIEALYSDIITNDFGVDVEISYYTQGRLEFRLYAPEIEKINDLENQNLFNKGIKVLVYNQDLDTIATLSADFAIQDEENKIVEVRKNVILKNFENEELNTEKLFWDRERKQIYTDDFVTLNTEDQIIMGFGFSADQYFSTYSLSNITGTIYL